MLWLSAVLIAAVSNLDNLAVGIAFGIRDTRIAIGPNLIIASLTTAATAGAIACGSVCSTLVPSAMASVLAASIIIGIGAATISTHRSVFPAPARTRARAAFHSTSAHEGRRAISYRAGLALGVALSVNNLGAGVGAGVAGVPLIGTTLVAGLLSLICVGGGSRLGRVLGAAFLPRRASVIAGLLLMLVGAAMLPGMQ